jgi:hypothetical protein
MRSVSKVSTIATRWVEPDATECHRLTKDAKTVQAHSEFGRPWARISSAYQCPAGSRLNTAVLPNLA